MKISFYLMTALLGLGVSPLALTQTPPPATYDVSTVKPSASKDDAMMLNWAKDHLKADNVTLAWMLTSAFHARRDQISGEPAWAKDQHFDIVAKLTDTDPAIVDKLTTDQHRALLLALLVERFGLKYHTETKQLPTYNLVPAKNGLKLTSAASPGDKAKRVNGQCDGCTWWGNNEVRAHDIDLPTFAEMLAGQLERNVHDDTGYTGKIDVALKWAPDLGTQPPSDADALPPLPQALEKQMGLHLVATKGPVTVYIVDRLNPPSDN
jgi:uncharacterized protein (TIGR03435 family)